jgi:hypothetical protein
VASPQIIDVICMAEQYKKRPSEIVFIDDEEYTAFCFDQVCLYLLNFCTDTKTGEINFKKLKFKNNQKNNNNDFLNHVKKQALRR